MPPISGAAGGELSRLTVTPTDVVPPALVAVHVIAPTPSPRAVGPQPTGSTTGDSGSVTLQPTVTGTRYQPPGPSAAAGEITGVMTGGVLSSTIGRARSASRNPAPQSTSGLPGAGQSSALAGSVMAA